METPSHRLRCPKVILQKFEDESQLGWITRQWRSSYHSGLVQQFSEIHDGQSGRWIYQFPRVPIYWKAPRPFVLNHDYWMIPHPWRRQGETEDLVIESLGHFVDFHEWRRYNQVSIWIGPPGPDSNSGIVRPQTFELPPVIKRGRDHPAGNWWEHHVNLDALRARCHTATDQATMIPGYYQAVAFPQESVVVPFRDRPTEFRPEPPDDPRPRSDIFSIGVP